MTLHAALRQIVEPYVPDDRLHRELVVQQSVSKLAQAVTRAPTWSTRSLRRRQPQRSGRAPSASLPRFGPESIAQTTFTRARRFFWHGFPSSWRERSSSPNARSGASDSTVRH